MEVIIRNDYSYSNNLVIPAVGDCCSTSMERDGRGEGEPNDSEALDVETNGFRLPGETDLSRLELVANIC